MTPGARIAAAIEILEKIERSSSPAEDVVSSYLRGRRYIGSKDRRNITDRIYGIQRQKSSPRLVKWHEYTSHARNS